MPDWLEQAIAKHQPGDTALPSPREPVRARETPDAETVAPTARVVEPPTEPEPSFSPQRYEEKPEAVPATRPSFADALAREQTRGPGDEMESDRAETPRTGRIIPMPGMETGLEPDFIPSRLRAKLEDEAEAPRRRASLAWVLATIFAVAAVVTVVLAVRFGVFGGKGGADSTRTVPVVAGDAATVSPQATAPAAATTPAAAETVATPPPAIAGDQGATVPASGVPYSGLGTSTDPKTAPAPARDAPPASAESQAVRRIYGIAVGTYFDRDRALQEAERVGSSLNLATRYMPVAEGGTTMFRAVVGRFSDRAEAERMAGALTGRGLANEGRVVLIGTIP